ncbi:S8 family serine peptidase [Actinoplanes sp. DH11]|uniref:S8 family serine peptidase n=1 Tax=Actinoplanes sp. DH11 TaxID=2857011 RepID=UPI0035B38E0B
MPWRGIRGSSPAAAVVSGAAALNYAMKPDASVADVRALLTEHAQPLSGYAGSGFFEPYLSGPGAERQSGRAPKA